MKLTKFEHACMVLQKGAASIIIDPGLFTTPITDQAGVVAIVITHEHPDHWTPEQLKRILDRNADARILGPAGVAAAATGYPVEIVADGDEVEIGPFAMKFFGGRHAVIHESVPSVDNIGVMVDDNFYYAGDSYTVPPVAVATLAVPVGAPWLKIGDAIDYVLEIAPKLSLPVHEMVLSQIGRSMANERIETATKRGGGEFHLVEPGLSLEI